MLDAVAALAGPESKFAGVRPTAMDACADYASEQSLSVLAGVLDRAAEPINLRQHAANALARINNDASRAQLVSSLQTAPERLAVVIAAALADSAQGAEALIGNGRREGKASPRLLQDTNVVARLRGRGIKDFEHRLSALTAKLPPRDERINELIVERRAAVLREQPDLASGAALFEKHCALCHRIGDKGAKIGPNLDGVGIRGIERLLEDILDPSRTVDQAFRTTQIVTVDGRSLTGLALREEGNILVLADAQGKEIRVPLDEIEQRVVSQLSVMPSNVADLVSEADFVHLIGYLLSQRAMTQAAR